MRLLILALALLLLPLRGWLGDAMALQALSETPAAAHASADAPHAMHGMDGMHSMDMSHDEAAADDHAVQPTSSHDCQTTCSDCQLCHSVAMTFPVLVALLNEAPRAAPASAVLAFASADPARGLKPPIS